MPGQGSGQDEFEMRAFVGLRNEGVAAFAELAGNRSDPADRRFPVDPTTRSQLDNAMPAPTCAPGGATASRGTRWCPADRSGGARSATMQRARERGITFVGRRVERCRRVPGRQGDSGCEQSDTDRLSFG